MTQSAMSGGGRREGKPEMDTSDTPPETSPVIDQNIVQRLVALAERVGPAAEEIKINLLRTFESDAAFRLQCLAEALNGEALNEEATQRAIDALHTLKGASSTLGVRRVADLCHRLEQQVKAGQHHQVRLSLGPLRAALEEGLGALTLAFGVELSPDAPPS
jgi:HPt (histidine-containing phosphotransfer) domain-containing protein